MNEAPKTEQVWDIATRLWHWLIVLAMPAMWWTAEEGMMEIHVPLGLAVTGLVVFRLFWGVFGSSTSKFASFVRGPKAILSYLGKLFAPNYKASFGHNPLGALSVVGIILVLAFQVGTGLFAVDVDGWHSGPFARLISFETGRFLAGLHETSFNLLLGFIVLHLAAILFYLLIKRVNLIGAMITGRKRAETPPNQLVKPGLIALFAGVLVSVGLAYYAFQF